MARSRKAEKPNIKDKAYENETFAHRRADWRGDPVCSSRSSFRLFVRTATAVAGRGRSGGASGAGSRFNSGGGGRADRCGAGLLLSDPGGLCRPRLRVCLGAGVLVGHQLRSGLGARLLAQWSWARWVCPWRLRVWPRGLGPCRGLASLTMEFDPIGSGGDRAREGECEAHPPVFYSNRRKVGDSMPSRSDPDSSPCSRRR